MQYNKPKKCKRVEENQWLLRQLTPVPLDLTKQRSFPPVAVPDLNVVVPTQTALIQIHGGKIENNLKRQKTNFTGWTRGGRAEEEGGACSDLINIQSVSSPLLLLAIRCAAGCCCIRVEAPFLRV